MRDEFRALLPLLFIPALVAIGAGTVSAQVPGSTTGRNYDARQVEQRRLPSEALRRQQSALALLQGLVPDLRYSLDAATGATRSLSSTTGYLTGPLSADPVTAATAFLAARAGLLGLTAEDASSFSLRDAVPSAVSGVTRVYLEQQAAGLPIYNAIFQANVNRDGRLISVSNQFLPGAAAAINTLVATVAADGAVSAAARHLGIELETPPAVVAVGKGSGSPVTVEAAELSLDPIEARQMLLPIRAAEVRLVWNFQTRTPDGRHWFDFTVDAETGRVWTRFDWVADAEYRVYEHPAESPNHVAPLPPADGRSLVADPASAAASPFGWHDTNGAAGAEFTIMRGNNAHAYDDADANNQPPSLEPDCGAALSCDFPLDLTSAPATYRPAAVANLFYWNNLVHDVQYAYGFDEAAGNFQANNYGNGGLGSDEVMAEAQDGGGVNNANFATPPDGSNPRMQMYLWTASSPDKDGDFDNGIIVHEYGHGISNRLVGGPSNVSCLGNTQQPGEGWSDWLALVYTARTGDQGTDVRGIGTYALDEPTDGTGIRTQPYSTDSAINTWTYQTISTGVSVPHGVGAVWAQALWEVYWALVDEHGFDPDLANAAGGAGNQRAMLYVTEGLKNTACSPTFLDARDGVIQATIDTYGGADTCRVWQAFADFGLGVDATTGGPNSLAATNGFEVPVECQCTPQPVADAGPDQTICLGAATTIGTAAQPATSYSWVPGGETSAQITVAPVATSLFTVTATTSCGSASDTVSVAVDDGSYAGLDENFELGATGWSASGLWHLTADSLCAPPGYSSPVSAFYYGQDGSCTYSTGGSNSGSLVSPVVTGITASSTLAFEYFRQVESYAGDYDWTRVEVSGDGGVSWSAVWARNARDASENAWTSSGPISLAAFAGQSVQVRFTFDTVDGVANGFTGWMIDDVVVTAESQCVGGGNNAPHADHQAVTTDEDTAVAVTLTASDVDGDPLTYSVVGGPANGTLSGAAPKLTYTPAADFNGADSFTFVANDGVVDSNLATVSITVNSVNDAPVASDQAVTTAEDTALPITLAASDPDGDPLIYVVMEGPLNGALSGEPPSLVYTPDADWSGTDSFTFAASDGPTDSNVATVTITVTPVNDAPVADNQSLTTAEDTEIALTLTASDVDGDALDFNLETVPAQGSLSGTAPNLTYTPDGDWSGTDSFTFTAVDGSATSNTATVTITVTPVNDAPLADGQSLATPEDTALAITLTGSDVDGDALTFAVVTPPANGSLSGTAPEVVYTPAADFNGADSFTFVANDGTVDSEAATVTMAVNGTNDAPVADGQSVAATEDTAFAITLTGSDVDGDALTFAVVTPPASGSLSGAAPDLVYTPAADFNGADGFTFRASDGTVDSNLATVAIDVAAVNDPPVAGGQDVSTARDTAVAITLTGSDVDGDPLTFSVATPPANGSLTGSAPNLTYTPNPGFTGSDAFTFTASDGSAVSDPATVSITVLAANDPPVADDQAVTTSEDTAVAITLTGSDPDGDPLTFSVQSGPANGSLSGAAPNLTYTPAPDFNGTDSFTFIAGDGAAESNVATVTVTVAAVNDPPVAAPQSAATDEDVPVAITLGGSDVDGDPLTYSVTVPPANGSLSGSPPSVTYTPNADFDGPDSFAFTVNDGSVDSSPATVTLAVAAINDPPIVTVTAPAGGTVVDEGMEVTFSANAVDVEDGDISSLVAWSSSLDGGLGAGATVATSSLSVGTHLVTATALDGGGLAGSATVTVTVEAVGGEPVTVVLTSIGAHDGWVRESSESSGVGGRSSSTGGGSRPLRPGDATGDRQYKAIVSFDTSVIPSGATVTAATLRLRRGRVIGSNPFTAGFGRLLVDVASGGFGGNVALENSDFQAAATAPAAAALSNAASDGAWSEGPLGAAGLAALDTAGITQMRLAFELDDNDDGGNDYIGYYSGDHSSSANRPQLVVTWVP